MTYISHEIYMAVLINEIQIFRVLQTNMLEKNALDNTYIVYTTL